MSREERDLGDVSEADLTISEVGFANSTPAYEQSRYSGDRTYSGRRSPSVFGPDPYIGFPETRINQATTSRSDLRDILQELLVNMQERDREREGERERRYSHQPLAIPNFDLARGTNPKAWIDLVDPVFNDYPQRSSDLILTLGKAMKGTAGVWLSEIITPDITWEKFKLLLMNEYGTVKRPPAVYSSILTGKCTGESYVSYVTKTIQIMNSCSKNMTREEQNISFLLAHLGQQDKRIQHLLMTKDIKTKDELTSELDYLSIGKRPYNDEIDHPYGEPKRPKFVDNRHKPFCNYCKRTGHQAKDCRKRSSQASNGTRRFKSPSFVRETVKRGECYICKSKDHYANSCPERKDNKQRGKFTERKVNLCAVNPHGSLMHQGEFFMFTFDSGSECSILCNKLQDKFSGPIFESTVILSGIGSSQVISKVQKITEVVVDGNHLNICFHIVPDNSIDYDIVIGREILNMGIKVSLTANTCTFIPTELNLSKAIKTKYNPEIQEASDIKPAIFENLNSIESDIACVTDAVGIPSNLNLNKNVALPISDSMPTDIVSDRKIVFTVSPNVNDKVSENQKRDCLDVINTEIAPDKKPELISILSKYQEHFSDGLPTTRVKTGELNIRLIDPSKIVTRRPYPLSLTDKKIVREHIIELEKAGIIRKSRSPFASPIKLVPKKNGKTRLCVDYRQLNANTISEHHPLPLIKDQIARLAGSYFFTTLDMTSGYHAIPVHPDSIERTAFVTPEGQYEYLTMPFGLKNGSSVYQSSLTTALGSLANECCTAYIDDVMVYAKTIDESLESLDKVLEALIAAGFTINIAKCTFVMKKVLFLGFEISAGEIRPNPQKIESLVSLPPPSNVSSLRQFIGLASYFRQFIPNFSSIAEPLYRLMTSKSDLIWLPEHEKARQTLIDHLTNEPVLMIFDESLPVELHCDACSIGYAGILIQISDNKPRVVAYFSKRTTPAESRYHSYELETLAVIQSIRHFHTYLQYCFFTVVTDCKSLKESYLKQDLNTRIHRWWSYLQGFDFKIVFRPATRMQHADFLSRHPLRESPIQTAKLGDKSSSELIPLIQAKEKVPEYPIMKVDLTTLPDDWLIISQRQDSDITEILRKLENNELSEEIRKSYELRKGVLCRNVQRNNRTRCLPIVPHAYKWSVINNVHEAVMHLGWDRTLEKVAELYWFRNMAKFVRKFVENCLTCKVAKTPSGKAQVQLNPIPKTVIPWHTVHVDISGKLSGKNDSKEYIIVLIDAFSKFVLLYHTRKIDSASVIKALRQSVSLFGAPSTLIADQGRSFVNSDVKQFCHKHQINLHIIATGAPRANGQVERVMSVLTNMLTATELGERTWQDAILDIQLAINCTVHRVTRSSPLELLIGKVARPLSLVVPTESIIGQNNIDLENMRDRAAQNMIKSAQYDKSRFDKGKAKIKLLSKGDLVFIQNEPRHQTKLSPKFRGPLRIIEVLDHDRYLLKSMTSNRTYKYPHDKVKLVPDSTTFPKISGEASDTEQQDSELLDE